MEALIADNVEISEKDIDRIEKAIRSGEAIGKVFPRLLTISTSQTGEGVTLKVQFSKKDGAPVRYIGGDDPEAAAAVREVDLRKRFYLGASDLAKKLGLTEPRSKALRWHFKIDEDDGCHHIFEFGKSKFMRFSDNAYTRIKGALSQGLDIDAIWAAYRVQLHQN
ncbi:conserved hypothetical protein [Burkholderia pseudomallei MSHR346]|nr:conserved hypothetical protein [Burkholderia pseudomallei MSHR346]